MTTREVQHNRAASRYELVEDGAVIGFADYVVRDDRVVLPHTVIDPDRRGHGLGAELIRATLDDIAPSGRSVVPTCWFVAEFIDEHPEYGHLLAR